MNRKQKPTQINVVWYEEERRLVSKLVTKLGLGQSALLRLALHKLAEQEGIEG